jgi:hypothetical protein
MRGSSWVAAQFEASQEGLSSMSEWVKWLRISYNTGFELGNWICWHLIPSTRDYGQYSAIADLHTLQFTVTHALGFSVFTAHIVTTYFMTVSLSIQITHKVFFPQPNSFLSIILQMPTQFSSSVPISYPGRLGSRNSIQFFSKSKLCYDRRSVGQSVLVSSTHLGLMTRYWLLFDIYRLVLRRAPSLTRGRVCRCSWNLLYNHFTLPTQKTASLLLGRRVYSAVA